MRIYRNLNDFQSAKPIITVGIFDGVHIGHSMILSRLIETAKLLNGESVVLTLWPHPQFVVKGYKDKIRLLNTLEEKITLLEEAGVGHLIIYPFTKELSEMGSREFVDNVLITNLRMDTLVVGYDNHLGKGQDGDFWQLKKYSEDLGFNLVRVNEEIVGDLKVSSTKIRVALRAGDIEKANLLLGYKYAFSGKVVEGNKLGRTIGFPTANIEPEDNNKVIPEEGVYAVEVNINGKEYHGLLNRGTRPSVENSDGIETIEVHILNFKKDIYGERITVRYVKKIREEFKFPNLEKLKDEIKKDREIALEIFKNGK